MEQDNKKEERDPVTIECHKRLMDILSKIKDSVKKTTWDAINPSNYEATLILAKKIEHSKII